MKERSAEEEEELAQLIGAIQDRVNAGEILDLEPIKQANPRFADALESFFNCDNLFKQALGDQDSPGGIPGGEELRLDLKAFPIERRLPDVALGTVYKLSGGQAERPRELVVLRAWFTPQEREKIETQVRHALAAQGEGFVPIIDMGRLNQVPFVLREHFAGRDLEGVFEEIRDGGGQLTMEQAVQGQVGAGEDISTADTARTLLQNPEHLHTLLSSFRAWAFVLDQAHRRGLVHGEIEPRCLKLDQHGTCAIQGAGLAWRGTGIDPGRMRSWRPHWLAPEVVDSSWGHVTWLSDVYSLMRGLAACLSLEMPEEAERVEDVLMHIAVGDRTWLDALPQGVPEPLRDMIEGATFPDPTRRTTSLAQVVETITGFLKASRGGGRKGWAGRMFRRS